MKFWSIGIDFKSAPLEDRSKAVHVEPSKLLEDFTELVWLSTCNRVEIYAVSETPAVQVRKSWAEISQMSDQEEQFKVFEDREALAHLFRVTSSMESMVVGETQITSQVKRAYDQAVQRSWVGPTLHRAFQAALQCAKKVRQKTEVGRLAVSIPSVGVKLAEKVLGNLESKTVGIIGLGEIGRVAAEHFASVNPKKILLYNRTEAVAQEVAKQLQIEALVAASSREVVDQCDVIVSAANAEMISAEDLRKLDQRGEGVFVLDLAVPRSVELLSDLERTFTFAIDDLRKIAEENQTLRLQEVKKAERIIEDEVNSCFAQLAPASISQTFGRLTDKVERLTHEELENLRSRISGVSEKDWAQIEKMAYRLTSKVLQDPIKELRLQVEHNSEAESLVQIFRKLFKI